MRRGPGQATGEARVRRQNMRQSQDRDGMRWRKQSPLESYLELPRATESHWKQLRKHWEPLSHARSTGASSVRPGMVRLSGPTRSSADGVTAGQQHPTTITIFIMMIHGGDGGGERMLWMLWMLWIMSFFLTLSPSATVSLSQAQAKKRQEAQPLSQAQGTGTHRYRHRYRHPLRP